MNVEGEQVWKLSGLALPEPGAQTVLGASRYRFPARVAQAMRALLDASVDAGPTRDRLLAWSIEMAEAAEAGLRGTDRADWLARVTVEMDNLRAALRWARQKPDVAAGLRLACAMAPYWQSHGLAAEGVREVELLLALADGDGAGQALDAATRTRALDSAAMLAAPPNAERSDPYRKYRGAVGNERALLENARSSAGAELPNGGGQCYAEPGASTMQRNPAPWVRKYGREQERRAARAALRTLPHDPPRNTRWQSGPA